MTKEISQITDTIVMVKPNYFGFNSQTVQDNQYQVATNTPENVIRENALEEFNQMVRKLEDNKLRVITLDSPLGPEGETTPDAVFPNNWFSTHPDTLVIYPMRALNRRLERQSQNLQKSLLGINVLYPQVLDLTTDEKNNLILEGTGSLVLDRINKIAYASLSQRTKKQELLKWCGVMDYKPLFFNTQNTQGIPIYHTNLLMSVGEKFGVICTEALPSSGDRIKVLRSLENSGKEIVYISMEQKNNMCGNILQTSNLENQKLIIMSERARKSFTPDNIKVLEKHGHIVPVKINQIETTGGGSARCMIAEIFSSNLTKI